MPLNGEPGSLRKITRPTSQTSQGWIHGEGSGSLLLPLPLEPKGNVEATRSWSFCLSRQSTRWTSTKSFSPAYPLSDQQRARTASGKRVDLSLNTVGESL